MSTSLFVKGVAFWSGGHDRPAAALLPARMRGRASPLTLMLAEVVAQAARRAGVDAARLPSVFGSAYGEMNTTGLLIAQLSAADGQLSPAKFQASVHNTAAAQLSIALHNPRFTTSIAAGHDTVAMCLVEAAAWLAQHPGELLVACADEAPCAALQPAAAFPQLAAAFVLSSEAAPGCARVELLAPEIYDGAASPYPTDNPVSSAVALAQALSAATPGIVALSSAAPDGYRVRVFPAEARGDR
jgi:hypothetical protein